jgi:hypothetical protein
MGRFTVRLPASLHGLLEQRAQEEGVSLNQYIIYALTRQVAPLYTVQPVPEQQVQEQRQRFAALLERLGPPDRATAAQFLAEREPAPPEDEQIAALVAQVRSLLTTSRQPVSLSER